jgi:hypothetical protein
MIFDTKWMDFWAFEKVDVSNQNRRTSLPHCGFCFENSGFYLEPLNPENKMDCWFKPVGSVELHCYVTLSSLQNRLAV